MKFYLSYFIGGLIGGAIGIGIVALLPGANDPIEDFWGLVVPFSLGGGGVIIGNIAGALFADRQGWTP